MENLLKGALDSQNLTIDLTISNHFKDKPYINELWDWVNSISSNGIDVPFVLKLQSQEFDFIQTKTFS